MPSSPDCKDEIFYAYPNKGKGFEGAPYQEGLLTPPCWGVNIGIERTTKPYPAARWSHDPVQYTVHVPEGHGVVAYRRGEDVMVDVRKMPFSLSFRNVHSSGREISHTVCMTEGDVRWTASPLMTEDEQQSLPRNEAFLPSHVL